MANGKYKYQDDINFDTFKIRLRELLDGRGYYMKDLATSINMNATSITRYFYDRNPDIIALWRIADHFNVSIDWLVGRSDSRYDLPDNIKDLISRYMIAKEQDRQVVDTLLSKYDV